jgi:hypothetical protein
MCVKNRELKAAEIYEHGNGVLVPRERHDENLRWAKRLLPDSIEKHDTHSSNAQRFKSACLSDCWNPYYKLSTYLYCAWYKVYKTELTYLFYVLSFLLLLLSPLSMSALLRLWGAKMVEALHYMSESRWFHSRWGHWHFSLTWFFRPTMTLGSVQPGTSPGEIKAAGAWGWQPCYPHVPNV